MSSILISIVVPVYKVEKYLERCVDSLIKQTYKNYEIILVDDGSPDNCPQMCDEYAKKYNRINVVHKENGGLSDARNAGVKEAKGEYILFVDSDDWIEESTCEMFAKFVEVRKVDIVAGNAKKIDGEKKTLMSRDEELNNKVVPGKEFLKHQLKSNKMYMAAWLNLYSREFLINNNLEFVKGRLHEDEEFTPRCFLKAQKVIGSNLVFYNYFIREDSITTKKKQETNAISIVKNCQDLEKIYDFIEDDELRILLNDTLVDRYLNAFQIGKLYKNRYQSLIDKKNLQKRVFSKRNRIKVMFFSFNKRLYYFVNYISKQIKEVW